MRKEARNARERKRNEILNIAYEQLRSKLPFVKRSDSKFKTLQLTIKYIRILELQLEQAVSLGLSETPLTIMGI